MPARSIFVMVLVIAILLATKLRVDAMNHYLSKQRYEDIYYIPPRQWLKPMALGYEKALADLIWMKFLIYFGEEFYRNRGAQYFTDYANAILELDQYFKEVYHRTASGLVSRTSNVSIQDIRMAISFLERGIRIFPDDGELAWDLGAAYTYDLVPRLSDKREKDKARARGIEYLQAAVLRGAGPSWLALSNVTQLKKLGRIEQAITYLEETYGLISDPAMRKQLELQLASLKSDAYAQALKHASEQFDAAHQRDFPYLSPTLYWIVGPRPPYDGLELILNNFDPLIERLN